jgi:hypothetical protein
MAVIFDHEAFVVNMEKWSVNVLNNDSNGVDNKELIEVNGLIRNHPVGKLELG